MRSNGEAWQLLCGMRVVEEDLVDDQGESVPGADLLQPEAFGVTGGVPGWVVGVDEEDGAGTGPDASLELVEVDPPAVVVEERVGAEADVFEVGQVVEEWVARLGDENLIARVAEQTEEVTVAFAGAGGQSDGVRGDGGSMITVISGYGLAS